MSNVQTLTIKYIDLTGQQPSTEATQMEQIQEVRRRIIYQGANIQMLSDALDEFKKDNKPLVIPQGL